MGAVPSHRVGPWPSRAAGLAVIAWALSVPAAECVGKFAVPVPV